MRAPRHCCWDRDSLSPQELTGFPDTSRAGVGESLTWHCRASISLWLQWHWWHVFILEIRPSSSISHISNCNRNNNWIQSLAFNVLMSAEDYFLITRLIRLTVFSGHPIFIVRGEGWNVLSCFIHLTQAGQKVILTILDIFFLTMFGFDPFWMENKTSIDFPWILFFHPVHACWNSCFLELL